jgi:hypothetical protein
MQLEGRGCVQLLLGRESDASGRRSYLRRVGNGLSLDQVRPRAPDPARPRALTAAGRGGQVRDEMMGSEEFAARNSNLRTRALAAMCPPRSAPPPSRARAPQQQSLPRAAPP